MDIAIRQEMSWMRVLAAESALAYPENKLIAVMDNPQAAHAALSEIQSRGLGLTELALLFGERDAQRLHQTAKPAGLRGWLTRLLKALSEEGTLLHTYTAMLRDGKALVAVTVPPYTDKRTLAALLQRHGAHLIHYYGTWTIESLAA